MGQTKRPSLETALTKCFHLRMPLLLTPKLDGASQAENLERVVAASNAGVFGVLDATSLSPIEIADAIHKAHEKTDRPFGVHLRTDSPQFELQFEQLIKAGPTLFCFSGGLLRAPDFDSCRNRGIRTLGIVEDVGAAVALSGLAVDYLGAANSELASLAKEKFKTPILLSLLGGADRLTGKILADSVKSGYQAVVASLMQTNSLLEFIQTLERDGLKAL